MKQGVAVATEPKSKILNKKDLIAYFIVAGTGAVIQLVSSSFIQDWFDLNLQQSILPSYLIGLVVGFVLTKLFAFDARKSSQTNREMVKFVMVALFSYLVTYLFTSVAVHISDRYFQEYEFTIPYSKKVVDINEMACYLFGMGWSFISNYTLHKTFTFRSTGFYDRLKTLIK